MNKVLVEHDGLFCIRAKYLFTMNYLDVCASTFTRAQTLKLKYKMFFIFKQMLFYKPYKFEMHKDLNSRMMAMSELVCVNLAFLYAVEQMFDVNLNLLSLNARAYTDSDVSLGIQRYESLVSSYF